MGKNKSDEEKIAIRALSLAALKVCEQQSTIVCDNIKLVASFSPVSELLAISTTHRFLLLNRETILHSIQCANGTVRRQSASQNDLLFSDFALLTSFLLESKNYDAYKKRKPNTKSDGTKFPAVLPYVEVK